MPDQAAAWGCNEEIWSKITAKRGFMKLCREGDEETFKRRLVRVQELLANPPEDTTTASKGRTNSRKIGNARAAKRQASRQRKTGPYELYGEVPDEVDVAAVTAQVNERLEFRMAKDYPKADQIREALAAQGIRIRDDFRTWSYKGLPVDE